MNLRQIISLLFTTIVLSNLGSLKAQTKPSITPRQVLENSLQEIIENGYENSQQLKYWCITSQNQSSMFTPTKYEILEDVEEYYNYTAKVRINSNNALGEPITRNWIFQLKKGYPNLAKYIPANIAVERTGGWCIDDMDHRRK